jgi:hypothetical protein
MNNRVLLLLPTEPLGVEAFVMLPALPTVVDRASEVLQLLQQLYNRTMMEVVT